jgi:ubiquitin-conjugating enzyme E2 Z
VIQPLEESLNIAPGGKTTPASNDHTKTGEGDAAEEKDEEERESYKSFDDLRKRRFLWYYESYTRTIDVESGKVKINEYFEEMPFESNNNEMTGQFNYPDLKKRLLKIKDELMNETVQWTDQGLNAKKDDLSIASNLSLQYQQIMEDFKERKYFSLDLSLVGGNPFVWEATYFGPPTTHLDGGVFNIKIHLSPRFPQEQPRVFLKTPIFHHHVSKDGILCYHTDRAGEMRHHIDAIVRTIEEESPPFDPRTTVNLEATKLFWGTPEERKKYYRALRRSVDDSTL